MHHVGKEYKVIRISSDEDVHNMIA